LVEIKYGVPIGTNASRWASYVSMRIRSYLDVTKVNFADQDTRNVDRVIQQMEDAFEVVSGRIFTKYYNHRMRKLINNFRYTCRKLILDGKDRE
jgi:hypothetical protein